MVGNDILVGVLVGNDIRVHCWGFAVYSVVIFVAMRHFVHKAQWTNASVLLLH